MRLRITFQMDAKTILTTVRINDETILILIWMEEKVY